MDHGIILFDGECNFCSKTVQFILKRDRSAFFQFSSLQGSTGQALLQKNQLPNDLQSIVYIEDSKVYTESDAALRISRHLDGWWWKAASIFRLLPRPLRDPVYRFIARNRYKWWGKAESCRLPNPEERERFI
ncbi:MAG: thiol-disulfide oxidoreductase DCC family protein [Bacillus sp. (in: firmicutes)]